VKAILHTQYLHGQIAVVDIHCSVVRSRPSAGIDNQATEAGYVHGTVVREAAAVGCDGRAPKPLALIVPLLTRLRLLILPDP
jgi:hypothetical protein